MSSVEPDAAERALFPRAIIAGHAGFAEGLASAVEQITGQGKVFITLSNLGLAPEDIAAMFGDTATQHGIRVFFTDLPGGSATFAVRRLMRSDPGLILVTGTNLPTLLEFVFHSDGDPAEAAQRAADKGRASLAMHGSG